jgi:hypothetical protein
MKLFLFETDDFDYDDWDAFAVLAGSKKDAKKFVEKALDGSYRQTVDDFTIREIDLASAPAGIMISSFNAG